MLRDLFAIEEGKYIRQILLHIKNFLLDKTKSEVKIGKVCHTSDEGDETNNERDVGE